MTIQGLGWMAVWCRTPVRDNNQVQAKVNVSIAGLLCFHMITCEVSAMCLVCKQLLRSNIPGSLIKTCGRYSLCSE